MAVHVSITLYKEVEDIDKSIDFLNEVRELLQGKITCKLHSQSTNCNPPEELTKEGNNE